MTATPKSFAETIERATRPMKLQAGGANSSKFFIDPAIQMPLFDEDNGDGKIHLSDAADHRISVHDSIQRAWQKLPLLLEQKRTEAKDESLTDIAVDASTPSKLILQGRYMLPEMAKPVYWAIRDNRVVFSFPLHKLSDLDKANLSNQVLNAFAKRSEKTDVKCAAMAISERGEALIAVNTPEGENMQINKECAESNLATLSKQLMGSHDRIMRLYVLGGSVNEHNEIDPGSKLISMCNTCVEKTYPVMHENALVTALPACGESVKIGLNKADYPGDVGRDEAWQTPYMNLKGPSIIHYSEEAEARAKHAYEEMLKNNLSLRKLQLSALTKGDQKNPNKAPAKMQGILSKIKNPTRDQINACLVAVIYEAIQKSHGTLDNIEASMIEITGKRPIYKHGETVFETTKRYICELEVRGPHYNAVTAPIITGLGHAKLSKRDNERVSHTWSMGFNTHGKVYDTSAEQWDRLQKRAGAELAGNLKVSFIPLNDGSAYPKDDVVERAMKDLNKGGFVGQKRMNAANGHQHGAGCSHSR